MEGLKLAFTPLGSPVPVSCTLLLKPFVPTTLIVVVVMDPGARVTLLEDACRLIPGIDAVLLSRPAVPLLQPAKEAIAAPMPRIMHSSIQRSLFWKIFNPHIVLSLVLSSRPVGS